MWQEVKGYDGKYQASFEGQIRRIYKTASPRILQPYKKKTGNKNAARRWLFVKLTDKNGKTKECAVHRIIAEVFWGSCPDGCVVRHKNELLTDNCAANLEYISRRELGRLTGASARRKPVVKINKKGEIIGNYSSARACGRKNFMSYQTIIDRCNGKTWTIFAPDGYAYSWDDDDKILNSALQKVEAERRKLA